ncbi:hypothetical protein SAMN04487949_0228 [Halogranum gelatinilyticum]|uniref:Uncharacterized protein n=1 Tax=Halogranum gelatinilyticum TaxID=660521 RepID=A0A1G9P4N2_9EURY|nr:hypothetical protein SAMN04487949_0228 [Halogranum gelatinilyticum]
MDSSLRFLLVAGAGLLIGVPLWMTLLAPEMLSFSLFTSLGFWGPVAFILLVMLVSFRAAQRTK